MRRECDWVAVHSGGGACPLMFWMLHSTLHRPRPRMKEINFSLDEFDSKTVRWTTFVPCIAFPSSYVSEKGWRRNNWQHFLFSSHLMCFDCSWLGSASFNPRRPPPDCGQAEQQCNHPRCEAAAAIWNYWPPACQCNCYRIGVFFVKCSVRCWLFKCLNLGNAVSQSWNDHLC